MSQSILECCEIIESDRDSVEFDPELEPESERKEEVEEQVDVTA